MKSIYSVIKGVISEVRDFFAKLWRTSKFIFKKFFYFLKIILLWIRLYLYKFFNFIYYAFVYYIDGLIWLFRQIKTFFIFVWRLIKKVFSEIFNFLANIFIYIYRFFRYIWLKILSFFKWLLGVIKKMILEFPQFLLFLLTFIMVLVISLFYTLYICFKVFYCALLNKAYRLDESKVIFIKPLHILPVNLVKGYVYTLKSLLSRKKKILVDTTESAFVDLIYYTSTFWLLTLGVVLLTVMLIITLPLAIIFGIVSLVAVPKEEDKFFEFFKKRLVLSKVVIETSFDLKALKYLGYQVTWQSKNHDLLSDEGMLNTSSPMLSGKDSVMVNLVVNVEKTTINSYEFTLPIQYNSSKDILLSTYKNIKLKENISEDIDFNELKTNPAVSLQIESMNPKIVSDHGVILNPSFSKKIKVHFVIKILYEGFYMKKRLSVSIFNRDAQSYLKAIGNTIPEEIMIHKGKIKIKAHKFVKIRFSSRDEKVVNVFGTVYPSDYDVKNDIDVTLSIDDYSVKKEIVLLRKGGKRGLKSELKQIVLPKVANDVNSIKLPEFTELGDDGFSYAVVWYKDGEPITDIAIPTVIKKSYFVSLKASISVNGIDGIKEMKLLIPRRSSKFACEHDLAILEPKIIDKYRLVLPKRGKDFSSRIFWISQNPTVISSNGVLRKKFMIEQAKNKEAIIKAIVNFKTKTLTKDFVFEIENNQFKEYKSNLNEFTVNEDKNVIEVTETC